ncbi:MAG: 50S ribosomal protein L18 [bacterium]|nr:50S ribosomal protein L18 [bacterium]
MKKIQERDIKRKRRHKRVRAKVKGTAMRPRLSVFRSNANVFLQLVDDVSGKTLASAHTSVKKGKEKQALGVRAGKAGEELAKKAHEKKIMNVVFDRGGYRYHGIVRAVAEGARKGGLKF